MSLTSLKCSNSPILGSVQAEAKGCPLDKGDPCWGERGAENCVPMNLILSLTGCPAGLAWRGDDVSTPLTDRQVGLSPGRRRRAEEM